MTEILDINKSTATEPVYVRTDVLKLQPEVVENRRWFHAHPELSFQEYNTSKKVAEILRSYNIKEVFEYVGRTGVVALIRGEAAAQSQRAINCIGLRADMDALPVQEASDVSYCSKNAGVMHACGHDGHMSGLLAAAYILNQPEMRKKFSGVVKLIFQPAEEDEGGAKAMIKDGCLEDGKLGPRVDSIYGIHLWSALPLGAVGCEEGPVMAAVDKFVIDVKGKGGHGAAPQGTVDAIVEAASLVTSLQTVISRNKDPLDSGVVTCGLIKGGYGYNIIADSVNIEGTCRSFTKDTQELIKSRMHSICCGVAATYGGEIDLDYRCMKVTYTTDSILPNFLMITLDGDPATVNSYPECNKVVIKAASKFVGETRSCLPQKTMGAEDFSYFLEQRPGTFFFVGAALPGEKRPHHKSEFDFDERAILLSASIFIEIILDQLGN